MPRKSKLSELVEQLRKSASISPKALIGAIYGDMLVPHGGTVWLGSLVQLAKLFDVAEYLARTSALRLVNEGWLHPTRIGKFSFYSMTDEHVARVKKNYPRVYQPQARAWSGVWYLLLTGASGLDRKEITALQQKLAWHGVGKLAPGVFISATEAIESIEIILTELDLRDRVEVMRAESILPKDTALLQNLVQRAWDIKSVAKEYSNFLKRYRPVRLALDEGEELDPELAFVLRTVMISEYRRIVLLDPRLPQELLPELWVGIQAFNLCKSIYQTTLGPSELYLRETVKTADGPIGQPGDVLYLRFGGLEQLETEQR